MLHVTGLNGTEIVGLGRTKEGFFVAVIEVDLN